MKEYTYATRYKERGPRETIHKIRSILHELGILTKELWMNDDVEGYHSLNLSIMGTNYFSNGKGTAFEYALASAYGELIERLQNLVILKKNRLMSRKALEHRGFYYAPDEKHISIEEFLNSKGKCFEVFTCEAASREEKRLLLEKWKTADYYSGNSDFITLPYCNINDDTINYLPVVMLMSRYGSNGMCAGNTPEEALVQGVSEIIERYCNFRFVQNEFVPPTVPEAYIMENCPQIYKMIKKLEGNGPFEVIVKDCSLGQGFPCLSVIFLDKRRRTYFVRFGAHPVFDIALERCLTELLQGKGLDNLDWMVGFSYYGCSAASKVNNSNEIFTTGGGQYPASFFSDQYSYGFSGFEYDGGRSNEEMLAYLMGLLQGKGYDILIRDVSFLGFPSYHVIAPFFSENGISNLEVINLLAAKKEAYPAVLQLDKADNSQLKQIIEYMRNAGFNPSDSVAKILHPTFKEGFPWNNIKRDLFIASAWYKTGDLDRACAAMDSYLNSSVPDRNSFSYVYYSCVKDYMLARAEGIDDEKKLHGILARLYSKELAGKVFSDMKNPDDIFKKCSGLNCFDCEKCPYARDCTYPEIEQIYMTLKDRYAQNVIDQKDIAGLAAFSNLRTHI